MGDQGIASSQRSIGDMEMGELSSLMHDNSKDLNGNPQSGEGESSPKGMFRLKKVNGCLQRAKEQLILVIQLEQVLEDVEYWSNHALICNFLGLRVSFPVLESWAC